MSRLTAAEREASLVTPGTPDGSRWILFVSPRESISELQNATVHAFSDTVAPIAGVTGTSGFVRFLEVK